MQKCLIINRLNLKYEKEKNIILLHCKITYIDILFGYDSNLVIPLDGRQVSNINNVNDS